MEDENNFIPHQSNESERIVHRTDIPKIQIETESTGDGPEDVFWLDFQSGDDAE